MMCDCEHCFCSDSNDCTTNKCDCMSCSCEKSNLFRSFLERHFPYLFSYKKLKIYT